MKKQEKKDLFFQKMFLDSLIPVGLIVFVLLAFSLMLLSKNANDNEKAMVRSKQEKLTQMCENITSELEQLEKTQRRILATDEMSQIAFFYRDFDYYTYYRLLLDVEKDLHNLVEDYRYAKNAWLYFYEPSVILSQQGYARELPFPVTEIQDGNENALYSAGQALYLIRKRNLYQIESGEETPICVSIVELDSTVLQETLSYLCEEGDRLRLYMPNGKIWVQTGENEKKFATIRDTISQEKIVAEIQLSALQLDANVHQLQLMVWIFVALVLVLSVFYFGLEYKRLYLPLKLLLVDAFHSVEGGDFSYRIPSQPSSLLSGIYENFNSFLAKMEFYIENNLRQKMLISEANYKQLQTQINPHFMYNSYYLLYRIIQDGDWENAKTLARYLGQFYQYITRSGEDEKPLEAELRHAQAYADIQVMRYRNIRVEFTPLPPELRDVRVPKLLIQPVIENVFTHAHECVETPGRIVVQVGYRQWETELLDIMIENSGSLTREQLQQIQTRLEHPEEAAETTALINIHKRLRLRYGPEAGLTASRSELGGLRITIRIVLE